MKEKSDQELIKSLVKLKQTFRRLGVKILEQSKKQLKKYIKKAKNGKSN